MSDTIVKTIFIEADKADVWAFLTDKDKLGAWFHAARNNLEKGKDYVLLSDAGDPLLGGTVLEMDPPTRLVYTFTHKWLKDHETTVSWELEDAFGGTRVILTHSGFEGCHDPLGMLMDHDAGWDEHVVKLRACFKQPNS